MDWEGFVNVLGQSIGDSAFWVGFVLVVVFALNRFAVSDSGPDESDPRVVARSFTTRFRYYLSAVAYVGCYEFAYGLLVGIGSFPFLQDILKEWIGTLNFTATDGSTVAIGTPAWAALAVTTILPAAPGFSAVDRKIRDTLQEFASIPHKARALAREIVAHLPERTAEDEAAGRGNDRDAARKRARQLDWLAKAVDTLQDGGDNPRNAPAYSGFFRTYGGVLQHARRRRQKLEESLTDSEVKTPLVIDELESMVNNAARFLACALLQIESSERDVRSALRETLGLTTLPVLQFDFNLKQIIISLIAVMALTFFIGVSTLKLALPQGGTLSIAMIGFIASWLPYSALMLVPSFIFAAGVQLYFMDLGQYRSKPAPLEDKLLALMSLFLLTFGIGILPPLLGMAWEQKIAGDNWVMQVLPFGLTPAFVALLFYFLSTRCFLQSRWGQMVLDFAVFAIVAGVSTWFATDVAIGFGLSIPDMSRVPSFTNEIALRVFSVTAGALVGTVGALQCLISRRTTMITDQSRG
jgi:hypothetical protein